jgi:hypothetical protein
MNEDLIVQIKDLLKGIDETETGSDDGWWETSFGAEFSAGKLKELIALIRRN